jgi:hypothetical protein
MDEETGFDAVLDMLNGMTDQQAESDIGEGSATEQNDGNDAGDSDTGGTTTTATDDEQGGTTADAITTDETKKVEKKPFEDRLQEVIDLNKAQAQRIAELEARFVQKSEPEKPDFVVIDPTKVDRAVAALKDEADELRAAGKITDAVRKEREIYQILDEVDANEARRKAFEDKKALAPNIEEFDKKVADAAEFYRAEKKIPADVWAKSADSFLAMCKVDPILGREYAERLQTSPVAAIAWAHEKLQKAVAGNDAERLRREKAKGGLPTTTSAVEQVTTSKAKTTKEKALSTGTVEDWADHLQDLTTHEE